MAKAELKTQKTEASVNDFIAAVAEEGVRVDSKRIIAFMSKATGAEPKMSGSGDHRIQFAAAEFRTRT